MFPLPRDFLGRETFLPSNRESQGGKWEGAEEEGEGIRGAGGRSLGGVGMGLGFVRGGRRAGNNLGLKSRLMRALGALALGAGAALGTGALGAAAARPGWRPARGAAAVAQGGGGQPGAAAEERTGVYPEGELWFDNQITDHFAVAHTESGSGPAFWSQRFFANATWFGGGEAPVFLCVGGEGPALEARVVQDGGLHCGHMIDLAQEVGALVLALEHRFYGKSMPAPDFSNHSLALLSSEQALGDLAQFHFYATNIFGLTDENKWVSFGGSYPGMLAGWARLKLPHLIHAAVSSSAPVFAQPDMVGYNNVVSKSLRSPHVGGSIACRDAVSASFEALGERLTSQVGQDYLEETFFVCQAGSLREQENWQVFSETFWGLFPLQDNDPSCSEPACDYKRICDMAETSGTDEPLEFLKNLYYTKRGKDCLSINRVADVTKLQDASNPERSWLWQTCTEFGFYQTCNPGSDCPFMQKPFVSSLDASLRLCDDVFGVPASVTKSRISFSNLMYGGMNPKGSRVLYMNGDVDPWSANSIVDSISVSLPAVWVEGASHHFWTHPKKPTDDGKVVEAREKISEQVQLWLLKSE